MPCSVRNTTPRRGPPLFPHCALSWCFSSPVQKVKVATRIAWMVKQETRWGFAHQLLLRCSFTHLKLKRSITQMPLPLVVMLATASSRSLAVLNPCWLYLIKTSLLQFVTVLATLDVSIFAVFCARVIF